MNTVRFLSTTTFAIVASLIAVGCGSSDEASKPPEGASYYQGEMKPKTRTPAPSGQAAGSAGTAGK